MQRPLLLPLLPAWPALQRLLREERGSEVVEKLLWIFAGALIVSVVAAGYSGSLKTLWTNISTAISGVTQAN